jgi:exosortase
LQLKGKRIKMLDDSSMEKMAQDIQNPAVSLVPRPSRNAQFALGWVTICLLVAAVYYQVLGKLVTDWWQTPDFSHGFLVPPFAAYLIWEKRRILLSTKIAPVWSGIAVMVLGLVVLLLGVYGSELFLSRVSFLIVLAGLILCFGGWQLLTELRFALLVLLLAIPLPAILFNQITFPLQILASKLASNLLPLFGVPVLREGNVIELPLMKLEVAEACSGIRSLMSLFTLSVLYGYFMEKSVWRRVALVLASVPIAIGANAARILGTGLCVQYWDPDKAQGFFHEFSGWVIFLFSLVCLYLVHRALCLFPAKRRQI